MSVTEQRKRALAILEKEKDKYGYSPIDYLIDSECRSVLDLPNRPINAQPYIRWMSKLTPAKKEEMSLSKEGLKLIMRWEGLSLKAYLCPARVWTIGYGHTRTAQAGMHIDEVKATALLYEDIERFQEAVRRLTKVPLTQYQFDALVSFTYNVGIEAFRKSTLLRYLNDGKYGLAASEFKRWTRAKGRKLPGLVNRRRNEREMFEGKQ